MKFRKEIKYWQRLFVNIAKVFAFNALSIEQWTFLNPEIC